LERADFTVARIAGRHYQMYNEQSRRFVTVPHHNRDLAKGTLAAIIQQAGLTRDEFLELV
jgi:predicted RNA binding protein YcfA (HicA-like mRNA interferase family)